MFAICSENENEPRTHHLCANILNNSGDIDRTNGINTDSNKRHISNSNSPFMNKLNKQYE